jgi:hypothetical protein
MSHRIETLLTWIYLKLEYVLSAILGVGSIILDVQTILIKLVLAFILGGVGALGGHFMKQLIVKLKRK